MAKLCAPTQSFYFVFFFFSIAEAPLFLLEWYRGVRDKRSTLVTVAVQDDISPFLVTDNIETWGQWHFLCTDLFHFNVHI